MFKSSPKSGAFFYFFNRFPDYKKYNANRLCWHLCFSFKISVSCFFKRRVVLVLSHLPFRQKTKKTKNILIFCCVCQQLLLFEPGHVF